MLGNILIALTLLCLYGLIQITSQPMPGGDRGVGYAFTMMITAAGFALFSGLLFWHLQAKGSFMWLELPFKNMWIFLSWVAFAISVVSLAFFRAEWHDGEFPAFLKSFSQIMGDIILPAMIIVPALLSLHTITRMGTIPWHMKFMFLPGIGISFLIAITMLVSYMRLSARENARVLKSEQQWQQKQQNEHLLSIQNHKPEDPLVNILSLTGRFHDPSVRDAAVAKVKERPDWEQELIRLLNETEWQSYVYTFLDGNTVDHPELFIQPLKTSLRRTADMIRRDIRDANNLQDWHFEHLSMDRCLRAIDEQFSKTGADFVPEIKAVSDALKSPKPEQFRDVEFTTTREIDEWLKNR